VWMKCDATQRRLSEVLAVIHGVRGGRCRLKVQAENARMWALKRSGLSQIRIFTASESSSKSAAGARRRVLLLVATAIFSFQVSSKSPLLPQKTQSRKPPSLERLQQGLPQLEASPRDHHLGGTWSFSKPSLILGSSWYSIHVFGLF
jgi:hypothetical protein